MPRRSMGRRSSSNKGANMRSSDCGNGSSGGAGGDACCLVGRHGAARLDNSEFPVLLYKEPIHGYVCGSSKYPPGKYLLSSLNPKPKVSGPSGFRLSATFIVK